MTTSAAIRIPARQFDNALLSAPILPTLLRLTAPNLAAMLVVALVAICQTAYVGMLGTTPLAAIALVFPLVMLTQMLSAGAMGGGVSSAISRALGAGELERAEALASHAIVIGGTAGLLFSVGFVVFGAPILRTLGGSGEVLEQALVYAEIALAGAILTWLLNTSASIVRGTGNMRVPSLALLAASGLQIVLGGALGLGIGPIPRLGLAGVASGLVVAQGLTMLYLLWFVRSGRGRGKLRFGALRRAIFFDIFKVGAMSALGPFQVVLTVLILTRLVADFGMEALAGYVEALAIVLVVSFISLGWRTGLVVATSVPLVLAVVLTVMNVAGLNLDRITLGSLIIALGLLVDDAIIAVEMMIVKMEQGSSRVRAAAFAWDSTAFPMLTGTLVTAAGFLPVGIARSTAGEYAGNIFWIVGLALVVSWIVAVFFTPYIGVKLLPNFSKHGSARGAHDIYDTRLYRALRVVGWSVRFRWVVIALTLGAFGSAIAAFTQVQQQFFPTSSRPELFIEVRMAEGSSIGVTEAAAKKAEALIKGDPDLEYYTTYVGEGSPRFFLALNPVLPNENFALIVLMTKGAEARERLKARLEGLVAQNVIPEARLRIDRLNFGPPVGFPVQFRVLGPDGDTVRSVADKVRTAMRANPHTRDVQFDWNEQKKSIRLEVDQDRARSLGLTPQDIAQTLETLLSGYTVTEYKEGIELVPVVARAVPEERLGLGSFEDLTIPTRSGAAVPISQVARVHYEFEEPILWRRNRDVVLTVRSDIAPGLQAPDVTTELMPAINEIAATLPPNMRIEVGGAVEESAKANAALFKIFPLMFLAMLVILMVQLNSFSTLFLVFSTAPLGLIGASFSLLAFDAPFGFNALLGLIALAGMIMRNTVILVDQIDADVASGLSRWDAIIESTVRRSRPLVLTALAAILAMIPLSRSVFWGPMAITMMGGLLVATILTLLFLPALYAAWFRVRRTAPALKQQRASFSLALGTP